jgi:hypothetical protein
VRPAQSSQILLTRQLVGEPRPELLISPRIITPTDRPPITSHNQTLLHSSGYAGHRFGFEERGPRYELEDPALLTRHDPRRERGNLGPYRGRGSS